MINTYCIEIPNGSRLCFPVELGNGRRKYVAFDSKMDDGKAYFYTDSKDVQQALEANNLYKKYGGRLVSSVGDPSEDSESTESTESTKSTKSTKSNAVSFEPKDYPEVTDLNGAVEVLHGDPYKIAASKLKGLAAVLAQAKACGASFPMLEAAQTQ